MDSKKTFILNKMIKDLLFDKIAKCKQFFDIWKGQFYQKIDDKFLNKIGSKKTTICLTNGFKKTFILLINDQRLCW